MKFKKLKYYSITPTSFLSEKEIEVILKFCLKYCVKTFGVNRRKKKDLVVIAEEYNPFFLLEVFGEYDPPTNTIKIYLDTCTTVGKMCSTFIHEYTHYLQPCATHYEKLLDKYGYDNHPYEVEARTTQYKYNRYLLKEMRDNS